MTTITCFWSVLIDKSKPPTVSKIFSDFNLWFPVTEIFPVTPTLGGLDIYYLGNWSFRLSNQKALCDHSEFLLMNARFIESFFNFRGFLKFFSCFASFWKRMKDFISDKLSVLYLYLLKYSKSSAVCVKLAIGLRIPKFGEQIFSTPNFQINKNWKKWNWR